MTAKRKSIDRTGEEIRSADPPPAAEGHEEAVLDPVSRIGCAVLEGVAEGQSELLRFLGSRAAKTATALARLAACRTPAEVLQVQLQIGADAATDCLAEAQKWIGVMEKSASENLALVP